MEVEQLKLSLDAIWTLLQDQQRKIDELESRGATVNGSGHSADDETKRLSRAGLLRTAALGVAGVAGAGALLNEQAGAAGAAIDEGQTAFSSATSSPTISIKNAAAGEALFATGRGDILAQVNSSSRVPVRSACTAT
jgi:hypothetical protein